MFMLRKSDWDIQKPGLILFLVQKLVQRSRATKPETPDSRLLTTGYSLRSDLGVRLRTFGELTAEA